MAVSQARIEKLSKALARQQRVTVAVGVPRSNQVELRYTRLLNGYVNFMAKQALKVLEGLKQIGYIQDVSFVSLFPAFQIEKQMLDYEESVIDRMEDIMDYGQQTHRRQFVQNINRVIGVDISNILTDFNLKMHMSTRIRTNIELIESIPREYFDKIEKAMRLGIDTGQNFFSIKDELQKIKGVTESRAKLIARDQTSKLSSDLNRLRQTNIGIAEYMWQTVGDGGVRESHQANDGRVFRWDTPPATGHPGTDINCRCIADPILTGLLSQIGVTA